MNKGKIYYTDLVLPKAKVVQDLFTRLTYLNVFTINFFRLKVEGMMEEGGGFLFENETSLGTCEDSFEKNSPINGLLSQFWHQ
jgi:hypothetical protein